MTTVPVFLLAVTFPLLSTSARLLSLDFQETKPAATSNALILKVSPKLSVLIWLPCQDKKSKIFNGIAAGI
jgi:hypothetical protein